MASDFSETHSCGTTMAAGASCLISVVFRPTAVGARTASMTVNTSAGAMVATVTGVGIGAEGQPHQGPLPGGFVPKSTLK